MSTLSTEPMRKRDVVVQHLRQLLRLVIVSALVASTMVAYHVATGRPLTSRNYEIVLFMLVALVAASILIAFNFKVWHLALPINAGVLLLTPTVLGHEVSGWLFASVLITTMLFLGASCLYAQWCQEKWWKETGTKDIYTPFEPFLENPRPPEKRPFRITPLSKAERLVIVYPTYASIFALMSAAKKAWTLEEVERLELEIMNRGAWDLYTRLEHKQYRQTAKGPLDTRDNLTKWLEKRVKRWLESGYTDPKQRLRLLSSAQIVLGSLLVGLPVFFMTCIGVGNMMPAPLITPRVAAFLPPFALFIAFAEVHVGLRLYGVSTVLRARIKADA